jgi:hypothetical protein
VGNFTIGNRVNTKCIYLDDNSVNYAGRLVCNSMSIPKKNLIILLAFLVMSFFSPYAYADDAVIGRTPVGVYPMMDAEVEMKSENIVVDIDRCAVECTFTFLNTGEAREVQMGFPGKLNEDMGSMFSDDVSLSLNNFRAFVNGVELPVKKEKGVQPKIDIPFYNEWYTFTVPFNAGETVTVVNTYTYQPTYNSIGDVSTGYVLQTGATWKGKIGKARVEFKLGSVNPWQIEQLKPGGFRFEGNSIIWERNNIEPTYDLEILYNTWHYSDEFLEMMEANDEDASTIISKIDKFKEIKKLADNNDKEGLLAEYIKAEQSRNTVLAVYIAGFMEKGQIPDDTPRLGDISIKPYGTTYNIRCDVQGLYTPGITLRISHMEDGELVIDHESSNSSIYIILKPEVEYDISFVAKDWLNRTVKKETKFLVPPGGAEGQAQADGSGDAEGDDTGEMAQAVNGIDNNLDAPGINEGGSDGADGAEETKVPDKTDNAGGGNNSGRLDGNEGADASLGRDVNNASESNTGDKSAPVDNTDSADDSASPPMESSKGGSKVLLWIVIVIAALGCMAAGFFAYIRSKSDMKAS